MATIKKLLQSAPRMRNTTPVPNGPLVQKKGKFKGSSLRKGGVVKAQEGITKSKTVYRSPDNMYKTVVKSKTGPGMEQKSVKEVRTLKGMIKGVPKTSGALDRKPNVPETVNQPNKIVRNGSKLKSKYKK